MDAAVGYDRTNRFDRTVDSTSSRSRHAGVPEEASSVSAGPEPRHNDSADNTDGRNIGADTHSYERSDNDVDNAGGSCGPHQPPVGRACLTCGRTFPSGNVFYRCHLTDARECPYATGSPPGSSGTPSGGSGGASADAGGRRDGASSANGSDAVVPEANAPGPGSDAPAVSSVSVPVPGLAGHLAGLLSAGDGDPALPGLLAAA
eukprot:CAMPEP_0172601400 /NCGR_PEP_ID=MMETSP1068-20121228/21540_1 /TAXON_ID=35684 /ORGANISM="Pseudopedinella elastica, Strain CCMP716" /LENGTH=203 /DNA_ID=CAMNT_0013402363 /DNA_START=140 /DNA_END=747 /DNA_ORIENTATION=+